ncbi:hypothetical protein DY000_02055313 [Brassica cretica]|uniref:Uncharacterized protein n=1 Tax=Brassica cretica TaxID=69181 RepID=A0ABQ7AF33_BRACR|nr:hypothetical protein DY000_02055313 [Brassica cretica]
MIGANGEVGDRVMMFSLSFIPSEDPVSYGLAYQLLRFLSYFECVSMLLHYGAFSSGYAVSNS